MIRIANGQGFWGDWLEAPVRLVEDGPIDYLILDYLAEVTMSILQKQKERDPNLGYASDFPPLIGRLQDKLRKNNIKVIANAGGVNPVACARAVLFLRMKLVRFQKARPLFLVRMVFRKQCVNKQKRAIYRYLMRPVLW